MPPFMSDYDIVSVCFKANLNLHTSQAHVQIAGVACRITSRKILRYKHLSATGPRRAPSSLAYPVRTVVNTTVCFLKPGESIFIPISRAPPKTINVTVIDLGGLIGFSSPTREIWRSSWNIFVSPEFF